MKIFLLILCSLFVLYLGGHFIGKNSSSNRLWETISNTTWYKENGWAGESYVFYNDDAGTAKCIHQTHGSGFATVSGEYCLLVLIDETHLKINDLVYEYVSGVLVSGAISLKLQFKEVFVSGRTKRASILNVKKVDFDPSNLEKIDSEN